MPIGIRTIAKLANVAPKASVRGTRPRTARARKPATVLDAVTVSVVFTAAGPLGVTVVGLKLHATNVCWLQLNVIGLLKPPDGVTVMVTVPGCPAASVSDCALLARAKAAGTALTVMA
jgi:hypothetical protein